MSLSDVSSQLAGAWGQSYWEMCAVSLAIAYLLLAVRQSRLCWYAAFVSTALYSWLFWDVQLLMESLLNVYYMGMAVYGWWHWRHGEQGGRPLQIQGWPWRHHAMVIAGILTVSVVSGALLSRYTQAAWPYLDSLTSWAAVVTTYMVARKVLANWGYWMVINSVNLFLFTDRGMHLTGLLYVAYLLISVYGWGSWYRDYQRQPDNVPDAEVAHD